MLHYYGMSYREVMDLPIRTFWMLNSSISRLMAEKDLRTLSLQIAGNGGEAMEQLHESLLEERGYVGKTAQDDPRTAVMDQQGFDELRNLAALC